MNQLTTMSLCLLATFGVLILQVNGDDFMELIKWDPCTDGAMEQMSNCFQEVMDDDASLNGHEETIICRKIRATSSNCEELNNGLYSCFSISNKTLISNAFSLMETSITFFCKTLELNFYSRVAINGHAGLCVASKRTEIKNCINQFLLPSNTTKKLSETDDPTCVKLVGFESCVMGHLSQCPSPLASELASEIFTIQKSESNCKAH